MSAVGTRKVFEDDRVIVWQLDLEPGEECERHTHELDYVARIISGSTIEVFGPDGESLYTVDRQPGDAISFRMVGDKVQSNMPGAIPIAATHSAKNVGTSAFREVLVEFKI